MAPKEIWDREFHRSVWYSTVRLWFQLKFLHWKFLFEIFTFQMKHKLLFFRKFVKCKQFPADWNLRLNILRLISIENNMAFPFLFSLFEDVNIKRVLDIWLTWNDDLGLSLLPTSALNTDMYITIPTSINKPERETDLITWTLSLCSSSGDNFTGSEQFR